ncbi:MFS transporter [Legionella tunisiensis]|uniref:MFS transporter n=1 Tax=Legionella tunisiensis TaxID=1034944 RepID=UPI00036FE391|nr:MFS transporter [Legionella tunisiensis]
MKQWIILFVICLAWSLMWVDFTAVNVALAPISKDLHTNLATLQWVITSYTVCSAAFMSIGGRLGDMYGHRRLFVLGTFIFTFSSILAGFSFNASLLIGSRIGQGIGIAMVVPIATALVYLTFDEKRQGIALGFLTGTTGIAMAIGPTIGGLLCTYLNWRWVFFINVPTGVIAIIMSYMLIDETQEKKVFKIDFLGIITLILGLLSFLLGLNKISDWRGSYLLGMFLLALAFFYLFIKCEQKIVNL